MSAGPPCRLCGAEVTRTFVDLGSTPLANSYLLPGQSFEEEARYPLHALVCDECLLVQLEALVSPEALFGNYAYFSSYSDSWLEHARRFAQAAIDRLRLGPQSMVVEVASNDGYLLRNFVAAGIPALGVEPAANVAKVAVEAGVPTDVAFFGVETATRLVQEGHAADLLVANNVMAHVPDLDDFLGGMAVVLKPGGVVAVEVPHLLRLIEDTQFDTIYHEHFSYFSLLSAERAMARHGLAVFDVEQLPTHGGSLRIWSAPVGAGREESPGLHEVRRLEQEAGLTRIEAYAGFEKKVERCRASVLAFLARTQEEGRHVVAYGAAAKGNTLLNFFGVTPAQIAYVVDRNPEKQGRLLPGSHLQVEPPERIFETRPDYVVILPWNLREEIADQLSGIRAWGGRTVTFVPEVQISG